MKFNEPFRLRLVLRQRCRKPKGRSAARPERSSTDGTCGEPSADRRRSREGPIAHPLLCAARRPGKGEFAAAGYLDEVTVETPLGSRPPRKLGAVDYGSMTAPPSYHCGACGVRDVKLWRGRPAATPALLCASCACAEQRCGPAIELPDGRVAVGKYGGAEIGRRVPAIIMPDGVGYYEYDSAPPAAKDWWLLLPLVMDSSEVCEHDLDGDTGTASAE
jgi:hypothetical protein